jgi:hypothetical protein
MNLGPVSDAKLIGHVLPDVKSAAAACNLSNRVEFLIFGRKTKGTTNQGARHAQEKGQRTG